MAFRGQETSWPPSKWLAKISRKSVDLFMVVPFLEMLLTQHRYLVFLLLEIYLPKIIEFFAHVCCFLEMLFYLQLLIFFCVPFLEMLILSIYIPWPFPPVLGVADNTKEQQKQWGPHSVPLAMTRDPAEFGWHCWSNTAHPPPSSTTYVASQMPSPLLPLPQGCPYKATPWQ